MAVSAGTVTVKVVLDEESLDAITSQIRQRLRIELDAILEKITGDLLYGGRLEHDMGCASHSVNKDRTAPQSCDCSVAARP